MGQAESDQNIINNAGFKKKQKKKSPFISNENHNNCCLESDTNGTNMPSKFYNSSSLSLNNSKIVTKKETNELKQNSIKKNNNKNSRNSKRPRKNKSEQNKPCKSNYSNSFAGSSGGGVLNQNNTKCSSTRRKNIFKNDVELIVRKKLITTTTTLQPIDSNQGESENQSNQNCIKNLQQENCQAFLSKSIKSDATINGDSSHVIGSDNGNLKSLITENGNRMYVEFI